MFPRHFYDQYKDSAISIQMNDCKGSFMQNESSENSGSDLSTTQIKDSNLFTCKILIREMHLDTFGHMNNAMYLQLFEQARWDLITHNGYDLDKIHQAKQGPVILDVYIKFAKELKLREEISITTELIEYKGKTGKLKQQMLKANGSLAAEAVFTFGLFDLQTRKLVDATPEWKKAIGMSL